MALLCNNVSHWLGASLETFVKSPIRHLGLANGNVWVSNVFCLHCVKDIQEYKSCYRADSRFAPSQWETPLLCKYLGWLVYMMTSSNGNIFHVTGPLCGEFTGHRWIPLKKASDMELDVFFDLHLNKWFSKQSWGWWFETLSCSLCRHCHVYDRPIDIWPPNFNWEANCSLLWGSLMSMNLYQWHREFHMKFEIEIPKQTEVMLLWKPFCACKWMKTCKKIDNFFYPPNSTDFKTVA